MRFLAANSTIVEQDERLIQIDFHAANGDRQRIAARDGFGDAN
jgi:hypothetical protein